MERTINPIQFRRITDEAEMVKILSGNDIINDFNDFEETRCKRTQDDVNPEWRNDLHFNPLVSLPCYRSGLYELYDIGAGYFMSFERANHDSTEKSIFIFHHENDGLKHTVAYPNKKA